jgi:putative endonuclease
MVMDKQYFVYILASKTRRLYIGVTNNLHRRLWEHRQKVTIGFAERYNINRLVYYEATESVLSAIQREKRLKNWPRLWKIRLIEGHNPDWKDLSEDWGEID